MNEATRSSCVHCHLLLWVMVKGKGTPTVEKEKEARQCKAWTLKEFGGKPLWDWMQLLC